MYGYTSLWFRRCKSLTRIVDLCLGGENTFGWDWAHLSTRSQLLTAMGAAGKLRFQGRSAESTKAEQFRYQQHCTQGQALTWSITLGQKQAQQQHVGSMQLQCMHGKPPLAAVSL
jgi:hypothetical protein